MVLVTAHYLHQQIQSQKQNENEKLYYKIAVTIADAKNNGNQSNNTLYI